MLLSSAVTAQTIYSKEELADTGHEWVNEYHPEGNLMNREIFISLSKILGSGFKKHTQYVQKVGLDLYVNAAGKIDYLVYDLPDSNIPADTIARIMKSELQPAFGSWELKGLNKNVRIGLFMMTEGKPVVRRPKSNDTTLTTLEELRQFVNTDRISKIDLSLLDLTSVPEEIYRFKNIRTLVLHGNQLTNVGLDLKKFKRLDFVDLNHNPVQKLKLTRTKKLENINLQGTGMVRVPRSLKKIRTLKSVWLGLNRDLVLKRRDFRRIRNARDLNLYACSLSTLSPQIKRLKKLEVLDLYYNQLTELPSTIVRLKNLTHLAVSNNKLESLPADLGSLQNLEFLYLHHNRLSRLPGTITALKKLKVLDLGYNWFYHYPDALAGIENLSELDLSSNSFDKFPGQLLELKNLDRLYLRGNPFLGKESDTTNTELANSIRELKTNNKEVFH